MLIRMTQHFCFLRRCLRTAALVAMATLMSFGLRGQVPTYLSTSFEPQRIGAQPLVWAFAQDPSGLLYAANNEGVLLYDGARWRLVPTERPVRALAVDADGTVYVGCIGDLGRLLIGPGQQLRYVSLGNSLPKAAQAEREFKLYATNEGIVAVGLSSAWVIESAKLIPKVTPVGLPGPTDGSALAGASVVVNIVEKGLYRISAAGAKAISGGDGFADLTLVDGTTLPSGEGLLLSSADQLYRLGKDGRLSPAELAGLAEYSSKNQGLILASLRGGTLALATARGGVALGSARGMGRTLRRKSGLPDDNIYALFADRNNGLWVAHGRGLTRLMPESPVDHFRLEHGLNGTVNALAIHQGDLYAATVQGIYRRAAGAFEPVGGVLSEAWSFAQAGTDLLAATNDGIYTVSGATAKRVVEASYVLKVVARARPAGDHVGWALSDVGVQKLMRSGSYRLGDTLDLPIATDDIQGLSTTVAGDLLVHTAAQGVWRVDAAGIVSVATDTTQGYPQGGGAAIPLAEGVLFSLRGGLWRAAALGEKGQPVRLQPVADYGRVEVVGAKGDTLLMNTSQGVLLGVISGNVVRVEPVGWTRLLPGRASAVAFGPSRTYISVQDELFALSLKEQVPGEGRLPLIVGITEAGRDSALVGELWWRGLRSIDPTALPLALQPEQNSLRFRFALPEFDQAFANRYQFKLTPDNATSDTAWSAWTDQAEHSFGGLDPGAYTFSVRARDAYGYVTAPATVAVRLATPLQFTWYAFVVYGLVMLGLIWVGGRMLSRGAEVRAMKLEQTVQERTREVKEQKAQIEAQVVELNTKNTELDSKNTALDTTLKQLNTKNLELDSKNAQLDSFVKDLNLKNAELDQTLTELKTTQNRLIQQEKMASLGQLVAGVAHEINTPVGIGVTAASKLDLRTKELAFKLKEGQVKKSDLDGYMNFAVEGCEMILKNLNRAAELIQSFKRVAVDQSADDERKINLHDYLHEVIVSISPSIKKSKVNVALNGPADIELITSPSSLSQIIINLVMNALIHAFEGRDEGVIRISYEQLPDRQLKFTVSDNGRGIPPEVLPKIFDPFFTTNRSKGGSGLGLHIVYNLVAQNLKGQLKAESELGKGSTFTFTMPMVQ